MTLRLIRWLIAKHVSTKTPCLFCEVYLAPAVAYIPSGKEMIKRQSLNIRMPWEKWPWFPLWFSTFTVGMIVIQTVLWLVIIPERSLYHMQATVYQGLNGETDFSPFWSLYWCLRSGACGFADFLFFLLSLYMLHSHLVGILCICHLWVIFPLLSICVCLVCTKWETMYFPCHRVVIPSLFTYCTERYIKYIKYSILIHPVQFNLLFWNGCPVQTPMAEWPLAVV